jgi:hypothetical protein
MKNDILPGDRVILSAANGLGRNPYTVLEVDPRVGNIFRLYVEGRNGQRWWARIEGTRVLPAEPEGGFSSDRYGDW